LLSDMEENVSPTKVARGLVSCNPRYLVSPVGILKLVEAVLLMLAWALCSGFRNGYDNAFYSTVYASSDIRYSSGGIGFFLFVTVTLWLIVIVFIVLGLLGLLEKLRIPMKMLIFAIFHAVSAVLLLIATAVIAADAAAIPSWWCENVVNNNKHFSTTCETYEAAVAFGAFSIIAFIVDAVLYFFNYRTGAGGPAATV